MSQVIWLAPTRRELTLLALKSLSTEQLQRGMAAFDHPPRAVWISLVDRHGCFIYEVYGGVQPGALNGAYCITVSLLSEAYETDNEWFRSECIREMAERGVTVEPPAVTASVQ